MQQIEPTNWVWNLEEVTSFNEKRTDNEVLIPEFDSLVALVSHRKPVETGSRREKLNVAEEIAMLKKQVCFVGSSIYYGIAQGLSPAPINIFTRTICLF